VTSDASHRRRFDALFAAHRLDVASYCMWRTASRADAEDAVAEVFLVAWRRIATVPSGDAARAWLYATARRVTANQRRSRRRRDALADRLAQERRTDAPRTGPTSPEEATVHATVHATLARLGDRDREVLLLVEWEGLRPAELATVLGCRVVTARGRLHRARRRFREAFEATRRQDRDPASPPSPPLGNGSGSTRGPRPSAPDPARTVHLTTRTAMRKAQP
jgi:RNA polymerase sigma factor (sigma-70 family)